MHELDGDGAFAHAGRDSLYGAVAHVADCEDTGHAGFEQAGNRGFRKRPLVDGGGKRLLGGFFVEVEIAGETASTAFAASAAIIEIYGLCRPRCRLRERPLDILTGPRMKYMLLVYTAEGAWTESERQHCFAESTELAHELKRTGKLLATSPLQSVATATSVQIREGKRVVTDGPFAETREQLGGYFLIDAQDLDEAIAIASRIPGARRGTVEIRPVLEIGGLPVR